jgi:hypothetical protein
MRIDTAVPIFGVFEAVELDRACRTSDRAEADPARIAQQFAVDAEALLAFSSITCRGRRSENLGSVPQVDPFGRCPSASTTL